MQKYAVIVAGGSGNRMKSDTPKQFLPLAGKPVLMHTTEAFHAFDSEMTIIIGLPADQISVWNHLCKNHSFTIPHIIIPGGETRFQTVKNCILEGNIKKNGLVAVHDGVRPFISKDLLNRGFNTAFKHSNAIPAVDLKESIRAVDNGQSHSLDRSKFKMIQTPQIFQSGLLLNTYLNTEEENWMTDDASVVEHFGQELKLYEGSYENIKITTPPDLIIAEALIQFFD